MSLKTWIKKKANSDSGILSVLCSAIVPWGRILYNVKEFFRSAQYRSILKMQILSGNEVQQTTPMTWEDRYPQVFAECRDHFANQGRTNIRILSYGCCTGEEVITLRRYFPDAEIIGAELNRDCLKICHERKVDDRITFIFSNQRNIEEQGPYDIIFAMAVFERNPSTVKENKPEDLSEFYPFSKFCKAVTELDSSVRNDGLFVIHYSFYDLMDTPLASSYERYGTSTYNMIRYDSNSHLVSDHVTQNSIFIKASAVGSTS